MRIQIHIILVNTMATMAEENGCQELVLPNKSLAIREPIPFQAQPLNRIFLYKADI
jgi:hypothetical protein